ncbi:hypothetical protein AF332_03655 [Sporosarcina globispora]|uniref:Uncharacterized protein n=1 Tax=Sporosarcina globispora TaxID=1459 RepID=A0A0M0G841_SPOGL|nr:hypothetical protein [Sporosarcina globispora]KON85994.1 hypothetical protein AF332_03655 [Sporosarcina globispora]
MNDLLFMDKGLSSDYSSQISADPVRMMTGFGLFLLDFRYSCPNEAWIRTVSSGFQLFLSE